jgi:hypothetical protein
MAYDTSIKMELLSATSKQLPNGHAPSCSIYPLIGLPPLIHNIGLRQSTMPFGFLSIAKFDLRHFA